MPGAGSWARPSTASAWRSISVSVARLHVERVVYTQVGQRNRQRDLKHRGAMVPALAPFDCLGLLWDADAKTLDCYVNGTYKGAAFSAVDFPTIHLNGDGEEMEPPDLFAAVSYSSNSNDAGACRFLTGRVDAFERVERLLALKRLMSGRGYGRHGKRFTLVTENGSTHAKMKAQKMKFALTRIHSRGVPDAVWVQTDQCRWTQSVKSVTVVALHVPRDIEACDLDVVLRPRYVKVLHRVTGAVYLEGSLHKPIVPSDCLWYVDEGILELVLAKDPVLYHAQSIVELSSWTQLFEMDDPLSDGDIQHDQTDLDPDRKRLEDLAQLRSSQQAKFELAKRAAVEATDQEWHWVHRGGEIEPSYCVGGEIGHDVPCDRDAALAASGEPRMVLGA